MCALVTASRRANRTAAPASPRRARVGNGLLKVPRMLTARPACGDRSADSSRLSARPTPAVACRLNVCRRVSPRTGTRDQPVIPALLRQAPFRNLWLVQTINVFGDQITFLAVPIVAVLILHADPAEMGLLTAAALLPHLFFSLPAGVWLDRVYHRPP